MAAVLPHLPYTPAEGLDPLQVYELHARCHSDSDNETISLITSLEIIIGSA